MLLDEIGSYLDTEGIGTRATDLFEGFMPDTPDACVALIETGGQASEHVLSSAVGAPAWEAPSFQVICRAGRRDYSTVRTKANDVFKKLDGLVNTTLSSVRYFSIFAIQSPFSIARDEQERPLLVFNCAVKKDIS